MPRKKRVMPRKKKNQTGRVLGDSTRKVQPRLRMIANGDLNVNTVRAERCASIAIDAAFLKKTPLLRTDAAAALRKGPPPRTVKPRTLKRVPARVLANVFIETRNATSKARRFPGEKARRANLVTAQVSLSEIKKIAADPDVTFIELGEALASPTPAVSEVKVGPPAPSLRKFGTAAQRKKAADVLIGIIDVQGFDFSHPDFLDDNGKTRFVAIWDQGGTGRPSPAAPRNSRRLGNPSRALNAAIAAFPKLKFRRTNWKINLRWIPGRTARTWPAMRRQSRRMFRRHDRRCLNLVVQGRR